MTKTALDQSTRIDLLERLESFASDDDEATPEDLAARFLPRREFQRALSPQIVILRGDRGAGKTSLFRVATSGATAPLLRADAWWEGYANAPGHPSGDTIETLAAEIDDRMLRAFWLTHLAGRLRHHDNELPAWVPAAYERAPADPKSWLKESADSIGQIQSSLDACDVELAAAGRTVTVAYDHLDRIGVTNRDVRVRASSTLMAIWLSLATRYRTIRGKLFLRNDLYEAGISSSADASKLETRSLDLEWTTQELYRALLRRLGADEALRGWVLSAIGLNALLDDETLGWMPPTHLPVEGPLSQKAIADALAGEIMGSGVKKGYTYRWIPNHLQDGNARIVPRSLFNLVRFAAGQALKTTPRASGMHLLHHTELGAALVDTSNRRVGELAEEYPIVSRLSSFRGATAPFTYAEAARALSSGNGARVGRAEDLIRDFIDIGVLSERKDGRLDLPDIYRFGLGVKRRGGVARPR